MFAARGGLDDSPTPDRANLWQGEFPHTNTKADGYEDTGMSHVGFRCVQSARK